MRTFVVTPPAPFITFDEAVARLKLDESDDEQADVEDMIATATAHLDGPDGWLGRALGPQVLETRIDSFGDRHHDSIFLPCRPIIEIVSISYIDANGMEQVIDGVAYELLGAEIVPAYNVSWPSPRRQREAVRIRYRAGYVMTGDNGEVVSVPRPIASAILLMVGDLYANRETTVDARASAAVPVPMSPTVDNLLTPFRLY